MKNKLFLFALVAFLSLTDAIYTLLNADPEYWTDYSKYGVELNPLGAWALQHGPVAFLLFVVFVWIAAIFLLMKYLPKKAGAWVGVAFWIGHMAGLATQGSYVIYDRLHVGDMTALICIMMAITAISTILLIYGFLKFNDYKLTPGDTQGRISSRRKNK